MDTNQASTLIKEAKRILWENPFDEIHDIFHHYRVWENAINIIFNEKLECDMNLLEVAIWWHDISKSDPNNSQEDDFYLFEKAGIACDVNQATRDQIKSTILEHQQMNSQTSLESKILYDADKIEYVSIPRILIAKNSLADEVRNVYEAKWRKNMEERYLSLNFQYSKDNFRRIIQELQTNGKSLFLSPELMNVNL